MSDSTFQRSLSFENYQNSLKEMFEDDEVNENKIEVDAFSSKDQLNSDKTSIDMNYSLSVSDKSAQDQDLNLESSTIQANSASRMRRKTGFIQRKDVVLKKLLRKMRGYYLKNFKVVTKYYQKKRDTNEKDFYTCCLSQYVNHEFGILDNEELVEVLRKLFNSEETRIYYPSSDIHNALYSFSYANFLKFIQDPLVRFIISHYDKVADKCNFTNDQNLGLKSIMEEVRGCQLS